MKTRILLAILSGIVMPILYFVVLGELQDRWFDLSEWLENSEGERPHIERWRYTAFYTVVVVMSVLQGFFICLYCIKTRFLPLYQRLIIYVVICIIIFIWAVMSMIFILTLPFKEFWAFWVL